MMRQTFYTLILSALLLLANTSLIRAAEALYRAQNNPFSGIQTGGKVSDFQAVMNQKRTLVQDLRQKKYMDIVREIGRAHV